VWTEKESETEGTTGKESKRETEGIMKREKEREREVWCVIERGDNTTLSWKCTKGVSERHREHEIQRKR